MRHEPHSKASAAVNERAVNIRSLALEGPNIRVALWVPPAPGIIPRPVSGSPIFVTSFPNDEEVRRLDEAEG
jgi:hypothetical protein